METITVDDGLGQNGLPGCPAADGTELAYGDEAGSHCPPIDGIVSDAAMQSVLVAVGAPF